MIRLLATLAFLFLLAGAAGARTPTVVVTSSERSGNWITYRLRADVRGRPVLVVAPYSAAIATLEVDGVIRQQAGRDAVVSSSALGWGFAALTLEHVRPSDRVVVRVRGSTAGLRFVADSDVVAQAGAVGFWTGAFLTFLIIVAVFQAAAIFVQRDATIVWYFTFVLAMIGEWFAVQGLLPFGRQGNIDGLLALALLSTVAIVGFSSSYLNLRTQAPKLFAFVVFCTTVPQSMTALILCVTHWPADVPNLAFAILCGTGSIVVVSAIRLWSGYSPAAFLGVGLVGLAVTFGAKVIRDLAGMPSPFLDRWSFEIGAVVDITAFTLGVGFRSNYLVRERKRMEQDLHDATFDAEHDELTRLLNRRGLEARFEDLDSVASTVLFVDLDYFKLINDLAGHAAGDDALKIMARILRHAVHLDDVVARVGGDEFVLVLVGCTDGGVANDVSARISAAVKFIRPLGAASPSQFGVSIGSAVTEVGKPFSDAIAGADADAYRVKAEHYAAARERELRSADPAGDAPSASKI